MGGRYFVSGLQLGMLRAFASGSFREERYDAVKLIDSIINEQFIGNIENYKNPRLIIQEYIDKAKFLPYDSEIEYLNAIIAFQKEKLRQIDKLIHQKYLNVGGIT
jgi:hypothetical protein